MKYRLLLLLAALIWGFAFVAQVIGMDSIGPYAFNGIRFLLGSLSLLPIIYYYPSGRNPKEASFSIWVAILMAGILLCGGATLQQVALQYTTASKTSFLTATYLLMVPVIGLFFGQVLRKKYAGCHAEDTDQLLSRKGFHHGNTRYRIWRFLSASLCRLLRGPYHSPQLSDAAFPACHTLIRTIHGRRYMQPYSGLLL